ncbi:protein rogdi-like [Liolophura sinensis]|uniref:protein rogdi-like n=1 Tax=Liolophura sinensis TaxID=3198878 RepID=UPI0031584BDF
MAESNDEVEALNKEFKWLIEEEVHHVLEEIHSVMIDCSRRFPLRSVPNEDTLLRPQRILLASPNGSSGSVKCVVTMLGDMLCEADVNFKHKQGNSSQHFRTSIKPDVPWRLQQVQDAGNHLCRAIRSLEDRDKNQCFQSATEVIMLLDMLMESLNRARGSLALPKRKSLEELISNRNMQSFNPSVPKDVALSFYIHSHKLILALYNLHPNQHQRLEISSRLQIESSVQWLNEVLILLTVALQQCQQFKDKIETLKSFEDLGLNHWFKYLE